MSLTLAGIPNPQQQIESLQRELYARNRQLAEAEEALRQEKIKNASIERGVQRLREVLGPLFDGLKLIHGEMDAMGIESAVSTSANPRKSAVWEDWKARLPGFPAMAIDALLLHGALNVDQLMIHLKTSRRQTAYETVHKLNKAGIINKRDGRISLKEL